MSLLSHLLPPLFLQLPSSGFRAVGLELGCREGAEVFLLTGTSVAFQLSSPDLEDG